MEEQIEAFKIQQNAILNLVDNVKENKRLCGKSNEQVLEELCENAERVVASISHGMSPIEVKNAWIVVINPDGLRDKSAARVLISHEGYNFTKDFQTFEGLITDGHNPSEFLVSLEAGCESVEAAMSLLVTEGVRLGRIPIDRAPYFEFKFTKWMFGVTWAQLKRSPPNSSNIVQLPWQWNWVMERALISDLTGRNLEVCIDIRMPEQLVPTQFVPLYRPIWTHIAPQFREFVVSSCRIYHPCVAPVGTHPLAISDSVKEAINMARLVQLTGSVDGIVSAGAVVASLAQQRP